MNSYFFEKKKTTTLVVVMCMAFISILLLLCFPSTVVSAKELDTASAFPSEEVLQKYLESDNLYDELNNKNLDKTIHNYTTGDSSESGDNAIVQIVPKGYFLTPGVFAKMGKEYGFLIWTVSDADNFHSEVFVFDISMESNTKGEFFYTVKPLFAYNYGAVYNETTDNYKIGPYMRYGSLVNTYCLTNVAFGSTILNENNYNLTDVGYDRANDYGPVIRQMRYNSKGYTGTQSQGNLHESAYIFIKRIGGYIPVVGNYIKIATGIIDTVEDVETIANSFVTKFNESGNNNEINTITYKDKGSYNSDEYYVRSSVVVPKEAIAYTLDHNQYVQSVLVVENIERAYRIYENISLEVGVLNRDGSVDTISTLSACLTSVHNDQTRMEIEENENFLVYTLPNGTNKFSFIPQYNGSYSFDGNLSADYLYYIYTANSSRGEAITPISKISLIANTKYYIDIVSASEYVNFANEKISLEKITKAGKINSFAASNCQSFVFDCQQNEILNIESSNSNVRIKNIINRSNSNDSLNNINMQEVSKKFFANYSYIIEFENISSLSVHCSFSFVDVSDLQSSFNPSSFTNYFSFEASITSDYVISLKYTNSNIEVELLTENLESKGFVQSFGIGYKTLQFALVKGEKVFIGIQDTSTYSENVQIAVNAVNNAYQWKINDELIDGNKIDIIQGQSAKLEFIVNGNVALKSFYTSTADYKFSTNNNIITIDDNCRIQNYFCIYPLLESRMTNGEIIESNVGLGCISYPLLVYPVANNKYDGIKVWNNQSGYGIAWDNPNIAYVNISITAGTVVYTKNNMYSVNVMSIIGSSYSDLNDIKVHINSIAIVGSTANDNVVDTVNNGDRNLSYPDYYINALFAGGTGENDNPYTISCLRHLENIHKTKYYDEDEGWYVGGHHFKLINNISLSGVVWTPFGMGVKAFTGTFDGNNHTISNLSLTINNSTLNDHYYGLFTVCKAFIKNLNVVNVSLSATNNATNYAVSVGAVSGLSYFSMENVHTSGTILGTGYVDIGGLSGVAGGEFYNCSSSVNIIGGYSIGGIVGSSYAYIKDCSYSGRITYSNKYSDHDCIGGIVGYHSEKNITNCAFTGKIVISYAETNSRTYQPYVGSVAGHMTSGTYSSFSSTGSINSSNLVVVHWTNGSKNYTFDQGKYVGIYVGYYGA